MEEIENMTAYKTADFLSEIELKSEKRKQEILNAKDEMQIDGQTYFVSSAGNDDWDGRTPKTAWRTLRKVTEASLKRGDGVLFRRGDIFRGKLCAQAGVTYAAYGEGVKPKLYGSDENLAKQDCWELVDSKHHIWKCTRKVLDVGTLVFNDGEACSRKLIPSFINGKFVCRDNPTKLFWIEEEMTQDLDLFCLYTGELEERFLNGETFLLPKTTAECYGELYLRCDCGNPGACFQSIEMLPARHIIVVGEQDHVRIDNLCIKYGGAHGIAAGGHVIGLRVTNCEIGWIGGCIQHYDGTDPNFPEIQPGQVTRYGNGVEIYGGCEDFEVSDCYFYQIYDAAITHQMTVREEIVKMENVLYRNNLVENCVYSIEYFLEKLQENESYMRGIEMSNNILRFSGYGWGQQRPNVDTPAHIKGWNHDNTARNFTIHDNIFDRSAYRMLHIVAHDKESVPKLYGNTYIQELGGVLGQYGEYSKAATEIIPFDEKVKERILEQLEDFGAIVCTIP